MQRRNPWGSISTDSQYFYEIRHWRYISADWLKVVREQVKLSGYWKIPAARSRLLIPIVRDPATTRLSYCDKFQREITVTTITNDALSTKMRPSSDYARTFQAEGTTECVEVNQQTGGEEKARQPQVTTWPLYGSTILVVRSIWRSDALCVEAGSTIRWSRRGWRQPMASV